MKMVRIVAETTLAGNAAHNRCNKPPRGWFGYHQHKYHNTSKRAVHILCNPEYGGLAITSARSLDTICCLHWRGQPRVWRGGGSRCLVLRGTRVPPSCQWAPVGGGILPPPGGMRIPPGGGRIRSPLGGKLLLFFQCFLSSRWSKSSLQSIPPGTRRILSPRDYFSNDFHHRLLIKV